MRSFGKTVEMIQIGMAAVKTARLCLYGSLSNWKCSKKTLPQSQNQLAITGLVPICIKETQLKIKVPLLCCHDTFRSLPSFPGKKEKKDNKINTSFHSFSSSGVCFPCSGRLEQACWCSGWRVGNRSS